MVAEDGRHICFGRFYMYPKAENGGAVNRTGPRLSDSGDIAQQGMAYKSIIGGKRVMSYLPHLVASSHAICIHFARIHRARLELLRLKIL